MFTGIVEEVGRISSALPTDITMTARQVLPGMHPGDSMAVNGVCLTMTLVGVDSFSVDIMPETVSRTNLGLLRAGDYVNLERPLALGGRLGGHLVQGHVDGMGKVLSVRSEGGGFLVSFEASPGIMRYIVEKGFIAVDGASLTIVGREAHSFMVSLVDYTRSHTTLGNLRAGSMVNLEVDIIAKYVEQLTRAHSRDISEDFLKEHGFLVG